MEQSKPAYTIFVAVDGSLASDEAYALVAKDLFRENHDHLVVGHITDKRKESYLPYNFKQQYLHDKYEAKLLPFGLKARYASREVDIMRGTKECLWELAENEGSNIIIVGNHGRKGPKAEDETVAGTAIQYLSLNSKFPVLVLKDVRLRSTKHDGCFRYGVCYDGSEKSKKAFEVVLALMKPTDKLVTITVMESILKEDDASMKHYLQEKIQGAGVTKFEMVFLPHKPDLAVYEVIKAFLKEQDPLIHGYIDYVAVGN